MEQSTDTDNCGSVTTASSSSQASFPLPLPQTMAIITSDNEHFKDKEVKERGEEEGERVIIKNQWTTTEGLHYLPTKVKTKSLCCINYER